jgi:hypothetical protein
MSDPIELKDQAFRAERLWRFDEARGLLRGAVATGEASEGLDAQHRLGKLPVFRGHTHSAEAELILRR